MSLTELGEVLEKLPKPKHPNLLVGINTADDAGVFRLSDEIALIQTVDFFTPIVDDPYTYGQISAANSLSDVYAMGGTPLTCLNVIGFPTKFFPPSVMLDILRGGMDKVEEAGAVLVGGHTITDDELKYGLAVTGTVHPERIIRNDGARPSDDLILTKPIGTGIISTALKQNKAKPEHIDMIVSYMAQLNKIPAECMQEVGVHAATDVTGFGLLGHGYELAVASGVHLEIYASKVPFFEEAFDYFEQACVPGGTSNNQYYMQSRASYDPSLRDAQITLLNDAQTSGGLLIAVAPEKSRKLLNLLHERGIKAARIIGKVIPPEGPHTIRVLP